MDCSNIFFKPDKIDLAFVVFLLFIMLCNVTFCAENETVDFIVVDGIWINPSANYFQATNSSVGYFYLEKGYIYHISNGLGNDRQMALSTDIPSLNVPYTFIGFVDSQSTFDYMAVNDDYLVFSFNPVSNISVTREKITNMGGVVSILSNDVGTNQFWNIFTLAIPFILIVVIVVFGFFIIRRLTKKESKGDIRF